MHARAAFHGRFARRARARDNRSRGDAKFFVRRCCCYYKVFRVCPGFPASDGKLDVLSLVRGKTDVGFLGGLRFLRE